MKIDRFGNISLIQSGNKVFDGAKGGKMYRTKNRDFILIDNHKNLYSPIREQVRSYFKGDGISWWGGQYLQRKLEIKKTSIRLSCC